MRPGRRWLALILLAVAGCRSTESGGDPYRARPVVGGFLLQTGHIQLGPRTGQNGVRWLGDGQNSLSFGAGSASDASSE